jgi:hypothetical protein
LKGRPTNLSSGLTPIRDPQNAIKVKRNGEVDSGRHVVAAKVVDSLFKHSSKCCEVEVHSVAARSLRWRHEVTLANLGDTCSNLVQAKDFSSILLRPIAFSCKVEL